MGKRMAQLKRTRSLLRSFAASTRGNVAMMFGITLVPLMIAAGVGLDYARGALVRSQMGDALDAASLAVGSTTGLDRDEAEALAKKYFEANYQGDTSNGKPQVTIGTDDYNAQGSVIVTARYTMPTMLLKLVGKTDVQISATSKVVWGQTKLWVALVLDNSGSMCQPLGQPCNNTTDATTKIYQLKAATKKMLTKLEAVSATAGDVRVGIVPFNRAIDVGTDNVNAAWIDWTDWEALPANVSSISSNVGPGSACPFGTDSTAYGFRCKASASQSSSSVNTIPNSGLICPGMDNGSINPDRHERYYNGCWDSVATQTKTETTTVTQPRTLQETCTQVNSGSIGCSTQNGYPRDAGSSSTSTTTTYTSGYTGDSTNTSADTTNGTYSDGTKSCSTKKNGNTTCSWTRTTPQTRITTTVKKTGANFTHTWQVNARSTWGGCIMDRDKTSDYDISNTTAVGFPAANLENPLSSTNCMYGDVTALNYAWSDLATKVDAMQARGSTNQAIGVAHGWQMLTQGGPYNTPMVPANTTRYIILFSDGLNTQNRWWGDGSTEGTVEDGYIDTRMNAACTAAKADGVIVYTLYVHTNGGGNSAPLQNCASDTSKYFDLTTVDQIDTAFTEITRQITNVRVAQ